MRILQVIGAQRAAGMERVVFDLTKALIANGHSLTVLCTPDLALFFRGTNARIISAIHKPFYIGYLLGAMILTLTRGCYDAIHIHGDGAAVMKTISLSRGTRTVMTLHGGEGAFFNDRISKLNRLFVRMCLQVGAARADRIAAVSNDAAKSFACFAQKISLVQNGVNLDAVRLAAHRNLHQAAMMTEAKRDGAICLFFPGRISAKLKGQDVAIESVALIVKHGLNVHLFISGTGSDLSYLRNLSQRLAIEKHVHFLGYVDYGTMLGYMQCADIILTHLAVQSPLSGLSQVHLEAAALAKPIITAFSDDLQLFRNSMYFAESAEEISITVSRIVADKEGAATIGLKAAKIVDTHFSWLKIAKTYVDLYELTNATDTPIESRPDQSDKIAAT